MIMQHLGAKELVTLRTTYETALVTYEETKAAYEAKKAAFITAIVAQYMAESAEFSAVRFQDWLRSVIQDPALEAEIWAATVAQLTPEAFQGWYMLRKNGADVRAFPAANNREAGQHLRSLRHSVRDKTIQWSYVPLAEAVYAKA